RGTIGTQFCIGQVLVINHNQRRRRYGYGGDFLKVKFSSFGSRQPTVNKIIKTDAHPMFTYRSRLVNSKFVVIELPGQGRPTGGMSRPSSPARNFAARSFG